MLTKIKKNTVHVAGRRREHGRGRPRQSRVRRQRRGMTSKQHAERWTSSRARSFTAQNLVWIRLLDLFVTWLSGPEGSAISLTNSSQWSSGHVLWHSPATYQSLGAHYHDHSWGLQRVRSKKTKMKAAKSNLRPVLWPVSDIALPSRPLSHATKLSIVAGRS